MTGIFRSNGKRAFRWPWRHAGHSGEMVAHSDRLRTAGAFMARYRVRIMDGVSIFLLTSLLTYYCFEYEVFEAFPHDDARGRSVDLNEMLLISSFLLGCMVMFTIRRLHEQKTETRRRIAAEQEVRELAYHDALTGLPNRRSFDDALIAAIHAPPRAGGCHAVLLLDLNGFKRVNDVFGHAVGDEVLIRVAGYLTTCLREDDLVARLGGDEFAILSKHLSGPEAATSIALRVIECFAEPVATGDGKHLVGVGIGIALAPQDGVSPADVLRKADIALYRAKSHAHSDLCFFEEEMDLRVRERHQVEQALLHALDAGQLEAYYQPLVELKSKQIRGFEALARWNHPSLEKMLPDRFIPIAEESGLIGRLTDQLLAQACQDAAAWPRDVILAFNVSPTLLHDDDFPLRVLSILARSGLSANRLELEITESAMVKDLKAAQQCLGALRDAGVKIALDDFGTGYSSLYHLRNFKVDRLKIDRSFVENMSTDKDSAAIVRALVGLGAGLGLQVTAEGVETGEQAQLLEEQGCAQVQGFLFSEAVNAHAAQQLVSGAACPIGAA